LPDLR